MPRELLSGWRLAVAASAELGGKWVLGSNWIRCNLGARKLLIIVRAVAYMKVSAVNGICCWSSDVAAIEAGKPHAIEWLAAIYGHCARLQPKQKVLIRYYVFYNILSIQLPAVQFV